MRTLLLATLMLALGAPAAQAAVQLDIRISPDEVRYGEATEITGTATDDGVPYAGRPIQLEGRRYPFDGEFEVID